MVSASPSIQNPERDWISIEFPNNPLTIWSHKVTRVIVKLEKDIFSNVFEPIDADWTKLAYSIFTEKAENLKQLLSDDKNIKRKVELLNKWCFWKFTLQTELNNKKWDQIISFFEPLTSLIGISTLVNKIDIFSVTMDMSKIRVVASGNHLFLYRKLSDKVSFSELQEYTITRLFINSIYNGNNIPFCEFIIILNELGYESFGEKLKEQFTKTREKYMEYLDSSLRVKDVSQIVADYLLGAADIIETTQNDKMKNLIKSAISEGESIYMGPIYQRLADPQNSNLKNFN